MCLLLRSSHVCLNSPAAILEIINTYRKLWNPCPRLTKVSSVVVHAHEQLTGWRAAAVHTTHITESVQNATSGTKPIVEEK